MKKTLLTILITAVICITGTATAAYVYTARDIGYQPTDTEWNVSNAGEALSSLKSDLNTVNQNVSEYKSQITEALAEKGVEVNENSTMSDITSGITNMGNGPTLVGSYSGNQTIDVSAYLKAGDTVDNFIIEFLGNDSAQGSKFDTKTSNTYALLNATTPSKTLTDNSLVISGMTITGGFYNGWYAMYASQPARYKVWHF